MSYTLASMYLQLLNPSVLQYRKACERAKVEDPVKILDKTLISDYFFDSGADAAASEATAGDDGRADKKADDAMDMSDDEAGAGSGEDAKGEAVQFSHTPSEKRSRSGSRSDKDKEHRRRGESRSRDKDRSSSSKNRHGQRSHSKSSRKEEESHDDRKKSSSKGSKTPMVPITNEQLVANLSTIVDKRDTADNASTPLKEKDGEKEDDGAATDDTPGADSTQMTPAITPVPTDDEGASNEEAEKKEKEDRELLLSWLSPAGFQVNSPTVASAIEADRDAVQRITALEIPVGDSASILRAGAGGEIVDKSNEATSASAGGSVKKRDFARVLDIYQEVVVAEEKAKRSSSSSGGKKRPPPPSSSHRGKSPRTSSGASSASGKSPKSIEGNPIIVVPNAMTSCITMINAGFFLGKDAVFIPRQQAMSNPDAGKRGGNITITRKLNARLGGSEITYDIIDNPMIRLKKDEWNRVVAVLCQGAAWQFKGWRYSDPVDLFSRTFGFFVGLEGAPVPNELRGWNVKTGQVSRDRRGSDNVCLASFWNGLEEFMAVHKRDLIK